MTKDMTQGSPLKLILAFAVPLMLGSLFQQFYGAGLRQRHRLRLLHPHFVDVRREGLP